METDPLHAQRIGAVLGGRYRLRRLLGIGGMGAVYEAEDPQGGTYAIKVLLGTLGGREETARFAREARLMATLSHPNVTRVVDSGVDATIGAPYLVMELLAGEDVETLVVRCGPLSPVLAVRIMLRAAAGIEAAHAAGVIHRDVKPANIFLHNEANGDITVKVCDFGIAKRLFGGETMTQSGDSMGSPSYMSPEQARDAKRVDGRTDVWGLGMTLYELLTGGTAFEHAKTIAEMMIMLSTREAPSLQHRAPWVKEGITLVTHGALVRDVDERCPNVGAWMGALRTLCEGSEHIDRRLFAPLSEEVMKQVAPHAELPRSWRDVEARVASQLPPRERESTMVRLLGRTLGDRYRLLGVLGCGGMGAVYETRGASGERLALKVLHGEGGAPKPDALTRFLREARAAMSITSEHVVKVVDADADQAQQLPFIVMELLEGQDLGALIRSAGAIDSGPVARVFAQACRGLADAHARGIIHRDIKPANIFLHELPSGEVVTKICDFGVAKQVFANDADETADDLTRTGGMLGSPMYFSPEQARNAKNVDQRTDIWSLAVSLYEALSGRRPWEACSSVGEIILAVCTEDVPPLQDAAPWITAELAAVVHRGLRRDPAERYASMEEFAAALEPFTTAPRLQRAMLVPVGPEGRSSVRARLTAPISSKTAYAATLSASVGASATNSPREPARRSSKWLLGVAVVVIPLVVLSGVAFRKSSKHVLPDPVATAETVPTPASEPPPATPPQVTPIVDPAPVTSGVTSVVASASASAKVPAPVRSGRRLNRPTPPVVRPVAPTVTAKPAPAATGDFVGNQHDNAD